MPSQKERIVFKSSFFRGELLNFGDSMGLLQTLISGWGLFLGGLLGIHIVRGLWHLYCFSSWCLERSQGFKERATPQGFDHHILVRSGQIITTSHDLGPQNVAEEGEIPGYFREISVGKSRLGKCEW